MVNGAKWGANICPCFFHASYFFFVFLCCYLLMIGFVIPKNVKTALLGELSFLGRIFGFTPFDAIPIEISNEDAIPK